MPDQEYRSHWGVCDTCESVVIVERETPLPDEAEWDDPYPSCPVCGESITGGLGNADELTIRDAEWRRAGLRAWSAVAKAFFDAADELEAHLDAAQPGAWAGIAYAGSPGWLRDKGERARDKSLGRAVSA